MTKQTRPSTAIQKTAELDNPLHALGFEIDVISPTLVSGSLKITDTCCQPFGVLHGGVSALIAEALGSIGAHVAAGFNRVAGIQLSINHVKAAQVGEEIVAEATPVNVGKTIQVWSVQIWKVDSESKEKGSLVASSKVTLLCNIPVPPDATAATTLKKYAKL